MTKFINIAEDQSEVTMNLICVKIRFQAACYLKPETTETVHPDDRELPGPLEARGGASVLPTANTSQRPRAPSGRRERPHERFRPAALARPEAGHRPPATTHMHRPAPGPQG